MVGIRASSKCDTCRVRKRKCLGEKPACSECIVSGWTCPGYRNEWKFMDETPRIQKYYSKKKYIYASPDSELDYEDDNWGNEPNVSILIPVKKTEKVEIPRFNGFDLLGSTLVYYLSTRSKTSLIHFDCISTYSEFIPARLGVNPALDETIRCLCAIYSYSTASMLKLGKDVYSSYVKAIKALRSCLNDPDLCMTPETLAASLLLHIFELLIHGDDTKWDYLARGSMRLLYARGVERYKTPFEYAMLESQYGFLFRQSSKFLEPCFLRLPQWQSLIRETPRQSFHESQSLSQKWRTTLCGVLLVHFSTIRIEFEAMCKTMDLKPRGWEGQRDRLIDMASDMLTQVRNWLAIEVDPVLVTKVGGIQYEDMHAAVVDCMAHIAIITTNRMLGALLFLFVGEGGPTSRQVELRSRLDSPKVVEERLLRTEGSVEFIKGESSSTGKLFEFGLQNCRGNSVLMVGAQGND